MMDIGDGGGGFDGPEFDAPEFNAEVEDLGQVRVCEEMPEGAVQLDDDNNNDDTLNFDDAGFSRTDLSATGEMVAEHQDQETEEAEEGDEKPKVARTRTRKRKLVLNQVTLIDMATMKAQLQDTSDITRKRWRGPRSVAKASLSPEEQLAAPLMPWLAPPVQDMLRACMKPGGYPFPVRMKKTAGAEGGDDSFGGGGGGGGGGAGVPEGEGEGVEEEEEEEELMSPDATADGNVGRC
ncbi:unnamed protein product [Hapterophycus canaliculatus]